MNIRISYQTQFTYSQPVQFSSHLFRLFPKTGRHLSISSLLFQTNPLADLHYRHDLFDNQVASVFYPEKSSSLSASLLIDLQIAPLNPFGFLLHPNASLFPFSYSPTESPVLAPFLHISSPISLPFWSPPSSPTPTVETLISLNSAIHQHIAYSRREDGPARPATETLDLRSGSCRDYAVLLADSARSLGLAARLASGYLCEFDNHQKVADGSLHAWTEIYLPGPGWIGFDPTNGYLCNHYHLTTAVGLSPDDISPIVGSFSPPLLSPPTMSSSLLIHPQ